MNIIKRYLTRTIGGAILLLLVIGSDCKTCVVFAADEKTETTTVDAFIIASDNSPLPKARLDVGMAGVSETKEIRVLLHNTTDVALVFTSVEPSCRCTKLTPTDGRIPPGGKLGFSMGIRTQDRPVAVRGGGTLQFMANGSPVFVVNFSYGFDRYIGFPLQLVVVGFPQKAKQERFSVPVVVGTDLQDESISVRVEGLDVDFEYELDRDSGTLKGVIGLKDHSNFSRLFGKMEIIDLSTGNAHSIPLIVEREDAIKIHPQMLRFAQPKRKGAYVARIYVRSQQGDTQGSPPCVVDAMLGTMSFSCVAKRLGSSISRVSIKASEKQVQSYRESLTDDGVATKHVKLHVQCADFSVDNEVPFHFQEFVE